MSEGSMEARVSVAFLYMTFQILFQSIQNERIPTN